MKQVLIVDDEARLLQSLEAGLKCYKDQFYVLTAENGRQAVDIMEHEAIDLIVTDLRMPEMDGFELLAYISTSFPFMPTIVMTAFATPEIEEWVKSIGTSKLLEKPIDFDRLAGAITDGLEQEAKEGSVAGFSLANFLQLLAMEQKTCLLNVQDGQVNGYVYMTEGEILAAMVGSIKGEEAVYQLLACENVRITFKKLPKKKITKMINKPLMSLLMEGMQRIDEKDQQQSDSSQPPTQEALEKPGQASDDPPAPTSIGSDITPQYNSGKLQVFMQQLIKGEKNMGKLEDSLSKLSDVDGFMAVGVFTPNGEMAAQVNSSNMKLAEIGSLANDVLMKAQKATDVMNVGRGQVVHIDAPKAHIIARCHNENEDFSQTATGKAHVHLILLLNKDANLTMGKIKLESIVHEVAEAFR